tara:strand:+ start:249 stop:527 length:279 start_codon:yes stop_codon:yes gene_type:complete
LDKPEFYWWNTIGLDDPEYEQRKVERLVGDILEQSTEDYKIDLKMIDNCCVDLILEFENQGVIKIAGDISGEIECITEYKLEEEMTFLGLCD